MPKKSAWKRFTKWLSNAVRDAHAWTANLITIACTTGAQYLAGLDAEKFLAMPPREKALRVLIAFGPGILMHIGTARQHQDAEAIVKKLLDKGVMLPTAQADDAKPPTP